MPSGGPASGGPTYICHPIDPSATPAGAPKDGASIPIPSGPVPTSSAPPVSTPVSGASVPPPVPTGGQASGAPALICYLADPAAIPAGSPTPIPSGPAPTSTPSVTY